MNRYISFYYIANSIMILSYPFFRYFLQRNAKLTEPDSYGYTRENGVFCTALALLWVRWKRSATIDHFLLSIFTVGKLCMTLLFGLIDIKYGLYYLAGCIFLFLFVKQPKFKGPSKTLPISSEEQFQELILKEQKGGKKPVRDAGGFANKNMWLVELFVDWAETCVYTKPIWSEFSNKYTTPNLKFAEVNLMTFPKIAEKYNINTSSISRQLPTLIMFEDGKEVIRFPPLDEDTKRYMKVIKYSKKDIAKYFDLEERYLATRFANNGPQKSVPKENKENENK